LSILFCPALACQKDIVEETKNRAKTRASPNIILMAMVSRNSFVFLEPRGLDLRWNRCWLPNGGLPLDQPGISGRSSGNLALMSTMELRSNLSTPIVNINNTALMKKFQQN